jgi:hypothetical protein
MALTTQRTLQPTTTAIRPTAIKLPTTTTAPKVAAPTNLATAVKTATTTPSTTAAARPTSTQATSTNLAAGLQTAAPRTTTATAQPATTSSGTAFPYVASNGKTYNITAAQIPALESSLTGQNYTNGGTGGGYTSTGSGITGGVQQTQMAGIDMTQPGAAEEFFRNTGYRYELPNNLTEQGSYWQQTMGQVAAPGVGEQTFNSVAPELRQQGTGERQVDAITGAYSPGNYPTGTNYTTQALGNAQAAQPGSLRTEGVGEQAYGALQNTYALGQTPVGTNLTGSQYGATQGHVPNQTLNDFGQAEAYAHRVNQTYAPGASPTGTNLMSSYAAGYDPTMLGKGGGEDMSALIAQLFQPGNTPGASNRADEFYQQFLGQIPDFKSDPGLQPYYDRAREKSAEDINRQMAARGMWGSSAAGGMIGEAMPDLGAEQANREAEYYLNLLGEQRNWQGLGGQLAGSADTSSRGKAANELAWTQGLSDIANSGQELELARAGENRQQTALGADIFRSADDVTNRQAQTERDWVDTLGNVNNSAQQMALNRASESRGWESLLGDLARSTDDLTARQGQDERAWADMLTGYGMDAQGLGLERTGQQLDWQSLLGQLSQNADSNSLAQSANELNWATGMGELGLQGDAQNLARLQALLGGGTDAQSQQLQRLGLGADITQNIDLAEIQRLQAGQNAATSAQSAQRARGQDYFNNSMGIGTAMDGVMTGQLNPLIDADKNSIDDILAMLTGSGAERLAGATRNTALSQQQTQQTQAATMAMLTRLLSL